MDQRRGVQSSATRNFLMRVTRGALFVLAGSSFLVALAWLALSSGEGVEMPTAVAGAPCPAGWTTSSAADFGATSGSLSAVAATSASDVWTVGYSYPPTAGTQSLIEHWNGSAWEVVSSPNTASTYNNLGAVSAVSPTDAWTVGSANTPPNRDTLIEHWDGSSWQIVPGAAGVGPYSSLDAVAGLSASDAWATGYTSTAEHNPSDALIEHWNGSSWQMVPAASGVGPYTSLDAVAALSTNDAWAFGYTGTGSGPSPALIEHWDGSSWTVVPSPSTGNQSGYLNSVSALSPTDIWAAGEVGNQALTEHWDGLSWQIVSASNPGTVENFFNSIAASSSDDVWAVGVQRDADAVVRSLIEHWNGVAWQVVPGANIAMGYSPLDSVVIASPGDIWTVGSQDANSGLLIEHLCGSFSSQTPTPTPGGKQEVWGDGDCSGDIGPRDAQAILKNVLVQSPLSQTQPCPAVGAQVTVDGVSRIWSDWDCGGDIGPRDAQAILKNVLVQDPLSQTQPCPAVGSTVQVVG
jgi:hypothetical protein